MKRKLIFGVVVILFLLGVYALYKVSSSPLPGVAQLQPGRDHHPEGSALTYNFNPPTSGDHYPSWITKGVYDAPRPDGNVVHSEEHGYIIFWYDCGALETGWRLITPAYAESDSMTQGGEGSPSATVQSLPQSFQSPKCEDLKKQLTDFYNQFGQHKLIVMPRPNMGHSLVLTAWGKSEIINLGDSNAKEEIKNFINAYRDHGPELTDEP